ncbi:GNAT family N-acetyltransferase [Bauldia sp.]|uniref:GNAT family N-acetyltransferase n=1 Tax=Bauldia sp. TaxID=2575872 RepID=UPI003BAA2388
MPETKSYSFRQVTMRDVPLLMDWRSRPHIRRWWDAGEPYDQDEIDDPRVARWIVALDGRPFAFMQDYAVHGWEEHHFAHLPEGSRGIDQYIGEPEMIGRGHGSAFIANRMKDMFDAGAPVIATDPHPDNARAIAVYEKLGFRAVGSPRETAWGLILPMHANRKNRSIGTAAASRSTGTGD